MRPIEDVEEVAPVMGKPLAPALEGLQVARGLQCPVTTCPPLDLAQDSWNWPWTCVSATGAWRWFSLLIHFESHQTWFLCLLNVS